MFSLAGFNAITGLAIWYFGGHPPTPLADDVFWADIVCNSNTYQDRQKRIKIRLADQVHCGICIGMYFHERTGGEFSS
jgi:hypothetical protein